MPTWVEKKVIGEKKLGMRWSQNRRWETRVRSLLWRDTEKGEEKSSKSRRRMIRSLLRLDQALIMGTEVFGR